MSEPTPEEIQRVREYECRMRGHTYVEIEAFQHDGPVTVVCDNCGKSWPVGEAA